jgi:hypothetical protein
MHHKPQAANRKPQTKVSLATISPRAFSADEDEVVESKAGCGMQRVLLDAAAAAEAMVAAA